MDSTHHCNFEQCHDPSKCVCSCEGQTTYLCKKHIEAHRSSKPDANHQLIWLIIDPDNSVRNNLRNYFQKNIGALRDLETSIIDRLETESKKLKEDTDKTVSFISEIKEKYQKIDQEIQNTVEIPAVGLTLAQRLLSLAPDTIWESIENLKNTGELVSTDRAFEIAHFYVLRYCQRPVKQILDHMIELNKCNIVYGRRQTLRQERLQNLDRELTLFKKKISQLNEENLKFVKAHNEKPNIESNKSEKVSAKSEKTWAQDMLEFYQDNSSVPTNSSQTQSTISQFDAHSTISDVDSRSTISDARSSSSDLHLHTNNSNNSR
ncbi:unnamed protein product [Blepharisma stoltei]|uniref:Uncharacterized protein n=1 Tax=Blepharisma stoltei TaxID=1481888 RepID=A0AAU9IC53_9CILI|nr:unnamed protein product [Blepharisma stoltei]